MSGYVGLRHMIVLFIKIVEWLLSVGVSSIDGRFVVVLLGTWDVFVWLGLFLFFGHTADFSQ
jgi:hypothetical protein